MKPSHPVTELQAYLEQYVVFHNPDHAFAAALWAVGTYFWNPTFDTFPYLVITSHTKRSGKTRLSEVLSFVSAVPQNISGMSAANVFHMIKKTEPTLFMDEAEFSVGATAKRRRADIMSAVLNSGYRRGQTVPRVHGTKIVQYPTYCPKCFILIGDVYDTLRDRSVVLMLTRGTPTARFLYEPAKAEGAGLAARVRAMADDVRPAIAEQYATIKLPFLNDRDEEIWLPLFAVCAVLAPERVEALQRVAVDMSTEKTEDARRYVNLMGAEQSADDDEYARRLLTDILAVIDGAKAIFTADALAKLKALPTAPWRKYRGEGLTDMELSNLLSRFGVAPELIRVGGKRPGARVARGYRKADIDRALAKL